MAVGFALEEVADGEDRAAEVREDHDSLAAVGARDRLSHGVAARAKRTARAAPGGLDLHLAAGHLGGQVGEASSQFSAVGDKYNPDQFRSSPARAFEPRIRVSGRRP
jgi:hypothetical protein